MEDQYDVLDNKENDLLNNQKNQDSNLQDKDSNLQDKDSNLQDKDSNLQDQVSNEIKDNNDTTELDISLPQLNNDLLSSLENTITSTNEMDNNIYDVNVSFLIKPENYILKEMFSSNISIIELRNTIAQKLSISIDNIELLYNGNNVSDTDYLSTWNINNDINFTFEMYIKYVPPSIEPVETLPYQIPEFIQVHINKDDGTSNVVVVEIQKISDYKKQYLGGYRDKKNGTIFHHASMQTLPTGPQILKNVKYERDTQTSSFITRSIQTRREFGTQMKRRDLAIDEGDKIIIPGDYLTADEFLIIKEQMVIRLQCFIRGYLARKKVQNMREQRYQEQLKLWQQQEDEYKNNEAKHQEEMKRRMNPKTPKDFQMIHNELEAWRLHETEVIKSESISEIDKNARLRELLAKETKLLQTIDKLKSTANKENKDLKIKSQLAAMAAPKAWNLSKGNVAVVHTPYTTRAQELGQLYNGLRLPNISTEERLDILLHVKWTVKEFDCAVSREIVELIDREVDMVKRGRGEKSLTGLRLRMSNLFLQFIETPEFNPESSKFKVTANNIRN